MRREWRVQGAFGDLVLVRAGDATSEERKLAISGAVAARLLSVWIPRGSASSRTMLLQLAGSAGSERVRSGESSETRVYGRLQDLLRSGRLLAVSPKGSQQYMTSHARAQAEASPPPEPEEPPPAEVKTWIEIRLVDLEGNPVPNEPFRIKLPNGATRNLVLTFDGRALVQDIDPGTCEVTFTAIDGREWELA